MHPILAQQIKKLAFEQDADVHTVANDLIAFLERHEAPPALITFAAGLPDVCERIDSNFAQFERKLELRMRTLQLNSTELLGINRQLRATLASREDALAKLQSLARRLDLPGTTASESHESPSDLRQVIEQVSKLIDEQQNHHAAIRALHADLANQKFALDQHAIVSITDLDGNITYANDRFCEINGYHREELLGKNHRIINSDQHSSDFFRDLWQTIGSGKVWRGELRNRKKCGDFYWVDATVVPLPGADGAPAQYIAIRTEITERKRIEHDLLLAKEAAESANNAKTEFLSGMSHELRTPMNAILGFAQLLQADLPSPDHRESLDEIMRAGRHLLDLINEILDLARIESGRLYLNREPLALGALIAECVNLVQPMAEQRQIAVACTIDCSPCGVEASDSTCQVLADKLRLRQVLLNLLSNAIKYNRRDGRVDIVCTCVDDEIHVAITDTGYGIAPELQSRLFQPFERLSLPPELTVVEGSGIGLALSKRLIEAMGGQIGVYSAPGTDSTFWITLPKATLDATLRISDSAPPEATAIRAAIARRQAVLYVEDNPANLRLVQKILSLLPGVVLLDAPDAKVGVAKAEAHLPDLILMDINLPGMNGFEALRCLRDNPATRHIPIVAVSANAMQRDVERARAAGFDDYLTKPLDLFRFNETVQSLLNPIPL